MADDAEMYPTDAQLTVAEERGRVAAQLEPRAASVRYDKRHGRVIVDLTNGCSFTFPAHLGQGLEHASHEQLADVAILGNGFGLHWEALDVDLSIPGLMSGLFGTGRHMARLAGKTRSPLKAAAARANGVKGGRPRKSG